MQDSKVVHRLLVVDDDANLASALQTILQHMGCEVVLASDGHKALDILKTHAISAIVTDVRMPNMDGVTLLESVEAAGINIPVIVMTGYSDYSADDIDDRNGVVLLEKPFSRAQIQEIVDNFINLLPSVA